MTDSYHFIGIGGIGMSGLARILVEQKQLVTGSDITFHSVIEELVHAGAVIYKGQAAENVPLHAKVVYTSDVKPENPEYQAAVKMKAPMLHRSELLAQLMKNQKALGVAGTHGKTTTSSLLATVLMHAGLDPSFAIGGMLTSYQKNARLGSKGEYFVFEADESDRSFLQYTPYGAIVTNIDNDHLVNYEGDFQLLVEDFRQFILQVQEQNYLFWCQDDPHLAQLDLSGQSYGFDPRSDWTIASMRQEGFRLFFDLVHEQEHYSEIEVALIGRHNVLNAAAIFGLSRTLGVEENSIREAFKNFQGVMRRCEKKGIANNILFIDDYGHHPTEIKATIQGIKQAIGPKRLIVVFQPHRYTRTKDCLQEFGTIFAGVDELIVTDIYGAGETPIPNISAAAVLSEIRQHSYVSSCYVPRTALSQFLYTLAVPEDVVVTFGAGDITKLADETLTLFENTFANQDDKCGFR